MTTFIAIEVALPAPSLFDGPPAVEVERRFAVHLAPLSPQQVVGECLCSFDLWNRNAAGDHVHTFSLGGGFRGPQFDHQPCTACADARTALDPSAAVEGTHAGLFTPGGP